MRRRNTTTKSRQLQTLRSFLRLSRRLAARSPRLRASLHDARIDSTTLRSKFISLHREPDANLPTWGGGDSARASARSRASFAHEITRSAREIVANRLRIFAPQSRTKNESRSHRSFSPTSFRRGVSSKPALRDRLTSLLSGGFAPRTCRTPGSVARYRGRSPQPGLPSAFFGLR